jgi:HD-GYP domain-containing protein (c-di-GMP phosphodiesterase class II)
MIADTLDAMTTDRPYRSALPLERALDEIRKYSGKQFDPRLAEIVNKSMAIRRLAAKGPPSAVAPEPAAFERAPSPNQERVAV